MRYARKVLWTFGVRVALVPIGMVTALVTARGLGPRDFGIYGAIGALMGTAGQIGSLGLPQTVTRFAAEDPERAPALCSNARYFGLLMALICWLVLAVPLGFPQMMGEVPVAFLLVAGLAQPFSFTSSLLQALLLGRGRVKAYSALDAAGRVLNLAAVLVVVIILKLKVLALVVSSVIVALIVYGASHFANGAAAWKGRPDPDLAQRMVGFSVKAWLTGLLFHLVLRSDLLLVNYFLGAERAGIYSLAVRCVDFLMLFPLVAGTMLLPRIASQEGRESARFTALVVRHTVWLMAVVVVVTAVGAPFVVPLLFGRPYAASVIPLLLLLPGVWCMAVQNLFSNDLFSRDYPWILPGIWGGAVGVNVVLNLIWLPRFGVPGASVASLVTYALVLIMIGSYWRRRFPEVSLRELVLLSRADFEALRGILVEFKTGRGIQGEGD